jgi:symplekin
MVEAQLERIMDLADFKLPPPKELSEDNRLDVISSSLTRIWDGADELRVGLPMDPLQSTGTSASELWMLLIVRMITRVAEPPPDFGGVGVDHKELHQLALYSRQDRLRQTLCDYIMADFPSRSVRVLLSVMLGSQLINRIRLATTWMNEEWYNDQIRSGKDLEWVRVFHPRDDFASIIFVCQRPNYETWLNQIVASYQTALDGKDKTFARFLLDLPSLPTDVLDLLRELCLDVTRYVSRLNVDVGFMMNSLQF